MENKAEQSRMVGTVSRGIRAPIIRQGDDLPAIVVDSILEAASKEGFSIRDRDVVAVTEAVVARAQGNYATIDQIAKDVREKFPSGNLGVIFPILSRNRFAICLKGIATGIASLKAEGKPGKIVLMLSYPADEVGNHLVSLEALDEKGIEPGTDVLTEQQFRDHFGVVVHPFTGVDYLSYYKELIESCGARAEVLLSNHAKTILEYTDEVLCCDIHSRARTKRLLYQAGAKTVYGLDDILTKPVDGSGYNEQYGLLGSNKATEDRVKLFPRDAQAFALEVQSRLLQRTGRHVEAMVYGDGAFKDPKGGIWELADPVVSPGYTPGLEGTPNELKLKYLADNDFANLTGEALREAISKSIREKDAQAADLKGNMASQGTTPRRLTDLIGSLCDLTSGSGDKGTPIVYIQGYFDNYTKE